MQGRPIKRSRRRRIKRVCVPTRCRHFEIIFEKTPRAHIKFWTPLAEADGFEWERLNTLYCVESRYKYFEASAHKRTVMMMSDWPQVDALECRSFRLQRQLTEEQLQRR